MLWSASPWHNAPCPKPWRLPSAAGLSASPSSITLCCAANSMSVSAGFAARTAKWGMEVHGALGVVEEFPVERWFREAMILAIWEGTAHRQILDGLEVMERKHAHRLLFERLAPAASAQELQQMQSRVEHLLGLGPEKTGEKEAQAEAVFTSLAAFAAEVLSRSHPR